MKGCLSFVLFLIFLNVLDVLVGKALPYEMAQTLRLGLTGILLTVGVVVTWRDRENLGRRGMALIWSFVAILMCAMTTVLLVVQR